MMTEEKEMEPTISPLASISTSYLLLRLSSGMAAFRFRCRQAISTKMMALSTTSPTATARPPRVMMLMASPKTGNIIIPNRTDRGMEISVMMAVRRFSSVRKMTIMTTAPAMSRVSVPLSRDISMKSAWR